MYLVTGVYLVPRGVYLVTGGVSGLGGQGCLVPGGVWSGGCLAWGVEVSGLGVGGVCSQGVSGPGGLSGLGGGGVWSRGGGCLLPGGGRWVGGCWGCLLPGGGGCIPACTEADTPPR